VAHPEQLQFFGLVAGHNRQAIMDGRVLEIGSYDVNGSVRALFDGAREYVGVDLIEGPGVDQVAYGHEIDEPVGAFDLTLSGECFEHDPQWSDTFTNMIRLTRPGGLVTFTCASHGRPEHGTRRSEVRDSPGTLAQNSDYYRNLRRTDFESLPLSTWFATWRFWLMPTTFDLYFAGVRGGAPSTFVLPTDEDVAPIGKLLPWPHRIARAPLRLAAAMIDDEQRYQDTILPYWRFLLRRSEPYQRASRTLTSQPDDQS
jgi:SAM-dependent methyltransferase